MLTLQDCYKILGLGPQASSREVRQAYLRLVKQWHPDSQAQAEYTSAQAQERFLQIQKAYEQIKLHLASQASQPEPTPSSPPSHSPSPQTTSTSLKAEVFYTNAVDLGRQGRYQDAIAELSSAIRMDPNFALAYKYRGHLRSILGLERQAEADLNKARVLERIGPRATVHNPADIEAIARKYSTSRRSARFSVRDRSSQAAPKLWVWLLVALGSLAGLSILLRIFPFGESRPVPSSPIQLEAPSVES